MMKLVAGAATLCFVACAALGNGAGLPKNAANLFANTKKASWTVGHLYVANAPNNVAVYSLGSPNLVETIPVAWEGSQLLFDSSGNLYVSGAGGVQVLAAGSGTLLRTIGSNEPLAIAIDASDNLYTLAFSDAARQQMITVYAPGSTIPQRTITDGLCDPRTLALDSSGNLYVANGVSSYYHCTGDSITVYGPGQSTPLRTIRSGVNDPTAIAFDSHEDLFVANNNTGKYVSNVTVYAPGNTSVLRTITSGVRYAVAVALDSADNLYVLNDAWNVAVYGPGDSAPIRSLYTHTFRPVAVTSDRHGEIAISYTDFDRRCGSRVKIYPNGGASVLLKIGRRDGVHCAGAVAFGP